MCTLAHLHLWQNCTYTGSIQSPVPASGHNTVNFEGFVLRWGFGLMQLHVWRRQRNSLGVADDRIRCGWFMSLQPDLSHKGSTQSTSDTTLLYNLVRMSLWEEAGSLTWVYAVYRCAYNSPGSSCIIKVFSVLCSTPISGALPRST